MVKGKDDESKDMNMMNKTARIEPKRQDRGLMEVLRRDVEGLGRQVSEPYWHIHIRRETCKVVQLRRDLSIAQDSAAEAPWASTV